MLFCLESYIAIGVSKAELENMFIDVRKLDLYTHKYCMPFENNKILYSCRNPKIDLKNYWKIAKFIDKDFLEIMRNESISAAISYYQKLKEQESSTLLFTERQINTLGYEYLNKGLVKEAIELFSFNIAEFPNSSNVYDSLGEAYMVNGDTKLAIEYYNKSLNLNPHNENAKQMIEKMRKFDNK